MSKKRVAELDTPFSSVEWPAISLEDQETILELLCTLLAPLGQHRQNHVPPSKGKRNRRRQRQKSQGAAESGDTPDVTAGPAAPSGQPSKLANVPPLLELAAFVDIGLTKITRVLAENACPSLQTVKDGGCAVQSVSTQLPASSPYSVIFVARSGHPSVFYSHFPQMVAVASRDRKRTSTDSPDASVASLSSIMDPIRLVGFSHGCEERLSACLGIPHVSSIALRAGATQSQGLVDFVRERVPPVEVQWLQEARAGDHRKTQIHMADVTVGPKKKKV